MYRDLGPLTPIFINILSDIGPYHQYITQYRNLKPYYGPFLGHLNELVNTALPSCQRQHCGGHHHLCVALETG